MVLRRRQVLRRCLFLVLVLLAAFVVYRQGIVEVRFVLDLTVRQPLQENGFNGSVGSNSNKPVCCTVHPSNATQSGILSIDKDRDKDSRNATTSVLRNTSNCMCYFHHNETLDKDTAHYKMVVGILSAKRDPPTVVRMAKELVNQVTEPRDYKFLVWMSQSAADEKDIICQLKELGFDVYVNNKSYPELEPHRIRITFKDPLQRVKWRTTHGKYRKIPCSHACTPFFVHFMLEGLNLLPGCGVTEILVWQKFWSGGPKFPENLVRRTIIFRKYWSTCGIMVRAQLLRCKHFNDTSLCQSVCIVSKSLKKSFGKQSKLLKLQNSCKYRLVCFN